MSQISVKNRQYPSLREWIEAELADQKAERMRLEREARLRDKRQLQNSRPVPRCRTLVSCVARSPSLEPKCL